jgi:hypothetical protein
VAGANGQASQATAFGMMAVPRVTAASLTALGEGEVLLVGDGTPARTAVRAHAVDAR